MAMQPLQCHGCGNYPLPAGAQYCPYCGRKFRTPTPPSSCTGESQLVQCGRCGGDGVDPGSRGFARNMCEACGGTGWVRV